MVDDQGRDKIPHLEEIAYLEVTFTNFRSIPRDKAEKEVKLEMPDVAMLPSY
jgi:hypothetical protein